MEKNKSTSSMKKLLPESINKLKKLNQKANSKEIGKKVKDSDLIHMGLTLIQDQHIKQLQEATYSEQDKLKIAHKEYCKKNGSVSFDKFIGILLRGEVKV